MAGLGGQYWQLLKGSTLMITEPEILILQLLAALEDAYRRGGVDGMIYELGRTLPVAGDVDKAIQGWEDLQKAAANGDDEGIGKGAADLVVGAIAAVAAAKGVVESADAGRRGFLERDRLAKINGAIGEHNTYSAALESGELGIEGPNNPNTPGKPDHITFDPVTDTIFANDSKYRGAGGSYPSQLKPGQLQRWMPYVENAIQALPEGDLKTSAQAAFAAGRVQGRILCWPP